MTNIDKRIFELLPHRPPMLLIEQLQEVNENGAVATLEVRTNSQYCGAQGVPACIGLEYMGQTAALIAGYQQQQGLTTPHLGFLLGCRRYDSEVSYFGVGKSLRVAATQATSVGDSLATFNCTIHDAESDAELAQAMLSVFRQALTE